LIPALGPARDALHPDLPQLRGGILLDIDIYQSRTKKTVLKDSRSNGCWKGLRYG
jgi:hypothetical protein